MLVVPSMAWRARSLSVYYEPLSISAVALQGHIVDILEHLPEAAVTGRRWHIPVCYDGPDLEADTSGRVQGLVMASVMAGDGQ